LSYRITSDFHTHTRYSDGKGSIEDNVLAAISKGLKRIAITDHGFAHIGIGTKKSDIEKMRHDIKAVNLRYPSIKVLLGVEANIIGINGEIDVPDEFLSKYDLILLGYHRAVMPYRIKDAWQLFLKNRLNAIYRIERQGIASVNTQALINAIERYPVSIITHPGAKAQFDIRLLARHAAKRNVALEINPHHDVYETRKDRISNHKMSSQMIPQKNIEYVKIALEEGVSFVINSDAHSPEEVGDFSVSIKIAQAAGVPADRIINAEV